MYDLVSENAQMGSRIDSNTTFVQPEYVQNTAASGLRHVLDLAKTRLRFRDGDNDPRQARGRALRDRFKPAIWRSGIFNLTTLPYLFTPEGNHLLRGTAASTTASLPASHDEIFRNVELRPRLRSGDERAKRLVIDKSLLFVRCCACAGVWEYKLNDSDSVFIWPGIPQKLEYVAISYVWGTVSDIVVRCETCDYLTVFPMESAQKFADILELAGSGVVVWLDAISIDQADHKDIAAQISVMGSIYKNAKKACVLLPATTHDASGFELLRELSDLAKQILDRPAHFYLNYEDSTAEVVERNNKDEWSKAAGYLIYGQYPNLPEYPGRPISAICRDFWETLDLFAAAVSNMTYWSRAWTYQEWALACDADIRLEGSRDGGKLTAVKTCIFSAGALISQYTVSNNDYAKIDFGSTTNDIYAKFRLLRRLFPIEDAMLARNEVDEELANRQHHGPALWGCEHSLGLRTVARTEMDHVSTSRLQLALDAFHSSERKARFEADLVACWASMCNIAYDYRKEDSQVCAVSKIKTAMRATGIDVFDFIPSQMEPMWNGPPSFFHYAKPHPVSNAAFGAEFSGLPIFTGRADALLHLEAILRQKLSRCLHNSDEFNPSSVHLIEGAMISRTASLSDTMDVMSVWHETLYSADSSDFLFNSLSDEVETFFSLVHPMLAQKYTLIQVIIPTIQAEGHEKKNIKCWCLCPTALKGADLYIVREGTNGTLALVVDTPSSVSLAACLTITDQRSGTILVRCDMQGNINLHLDTPRQSGVDGVFKGGPRLTDDRKLTCKIGLESFPLLVWQLKSSGASKHLSQLEPRRRSM